MELLQYFDDGRETAATDLYANVIGTGLGAIGGILIGRNFQWPLLRAVAANRVPALLLGAWVGYRLFPYVPTIDLHKYWNAVKPVIMHPIPTGYDLFRYTAIWLTIGALIEAIFGPRRAWLMFPLFVGLVLIAKVLMVDTTLTAAEIGGAGFAFCAWGLLSANTRLRMVVIALLFCGYVIAERLEPFQFGNTGRSFGWVPFSGFMSGSQEMGVLSFFQKFFLFGSSIWLLAKTGLWLRSSIALIAAILLVTSYAEIYLPSRSAEITDAVMALIIGAVFALIGAVEEWQPGPRLAVSGSDPVARRPIAKPRMIKSNRFNNRKHGPAPRESTGAVLRASGHRRLKTFAALVVRTLASR